MPAGLPFPSLLTSPHQPRFAVHRLRPHLYRPSRTLPPLHRRRLHRSLPPPVPTPYTDPLHRLPQACTDSPSPRPARTSPALHRLPQPSYALALVCLTVSAEVPRIDPDVPQVDLAVLQMSI